MSTEQSLRSEHRPDALYQAVFAHEGPWTEADWWALPEMRSRVELVDGVLVVSPLSVVAHSRLVLAVTRQLADTCRDPRWEALPGANVRLWQDHIREPDVVVIRAGLQGKQVEIPDVLMLVEVTSPGNHRQDTIVKHGNYAEAGVPCSLRIDLRKGIDDLTASAYELVEGSYREYATAPDGVLRLGRPWPLEADLRAMARGRGQA